MAVKVRFSPGIVKLAPISVPKMDFEHDFKTIKTRMYVFYVHKWLNWQEKTTLLMTNSFGISFVDVAENETI